MDCPDRRKGGLLTTHQTIYAFILGACRGDPNRADAVIECIFFDDQAVAFVARIREIPRTTLWDEVERVRAMLRVSYMRLIVDGHTPENLSENPTGVSAEKIAESAAAVSENPALRGKA